LFTISVSIIHYKPVQSTSTTLQVILLVAYYASFRFQAQSKMNSPLVNLAYGTILTSELALVGMVQYTALLAQVLVLNCTRLLFLLYSTSIHYYFAPGTTSTEYFAVTLDWVNSMSREN
jgi:hypothetical protein